MRLNKTYRICTMTLLALLAGVFFNVSHAANRGPFVYAHSYDQLKQMVNRSIAAKKPVLIYFFATWCHFCQAVDRNVFGNASVRNNLNGITAIGVDGSDNTYAQVTMMNAYQVEAFPTIVVYDKNGNMSQPSEFSGGITKAGMLTVLHELKG